jgi:hypothetical protein
VTRRIELFDLERDCPDLFHGGPRSDDARELEQFVSFCRWGIRRMGAELFGAFLVVQGETLRGGDDDAVQA